MHNNIPVLTLWVLHVFQDIAKWYGSNIHSDSCAILTLIRMSWHSHEWAVTAVRLVEYADLTRVIETCKYHHRNKICELLLEFEICHVRDDSCCTSTSVVCVASLPRHLRTFLSSTVEHRKERKCCHQNGRHMSFLLERNKTTCLAADVMLILPPVVHISGVIRKWWLTCEWECSRWLRCT